MIEDDNCVAAIQGALRMSGLFSQVEDGSSGRRFVDLCGNDTPDPSKLAQTMRLYTMFPQMPDPMPLERVEYNPRNLLHVRRDRPACA